MTAKVKPTLLPDITINGVVKNAAHLRTKKARCIVSHYSDTSTVKQMIAAWKTRPKAKGQTYATGTNYSVDKDGSIIEWADPIIYWVQSTENASTTHTVKETVAVDFICLANEPLTTAQIRSGAALFLHISNICGFGGLKPLPEAIRRVNGQQPVLSEAQLALYNVFPHGSFAHDWTQCCGVLINLTELCQFAAVDKKTTLTTVPNGQQVITQKGI